MNGKVHMGIRYFYRWSNIHTTLRLYAMSLLIFFLFRAILFVTELGRINDGVPLSSIFHAFFMGLRFDLVISGYLLVIPFLVLSVLFISGRWHKRVTGSLFYFIFISFFLAFLVSAADIPYFNQFFSRFSVTAFEWADSPLFVAKMIIQEPRYWLAAVPFLAFTFIFFKGLRRIWAKVDAPTGQETRAAIKIVVSVVFLGLMLLGIRGRVDEKSPIRVGTAYFSNYPFLNQLGLNPNFTLIRSILDKMNEENRAIHLMKDEEAIAIVQKNLNIPAGNRSFPLLRYVNGSLSGELRHRNVVLVIMESMSAAKMKRHGNVKNLTPFLDSLAEHGLYFENIYSSGIHTFNGVFSTFFSFPAIFRQHPMREGAMLKYNGMASTLRQCGYATAYFTTHDGQFDNIEGFLRANDFQKVITKSDYPEDKVKTTLGVPDDFMFEFSIGELNRMAEKGKPFFAAFMTASDHGPYYIPEYFTPRNSDAKDGIVEYADWSLRKFVKSASSQKWFNNTVFVFIADHGAPIDATYEMPLSYNHVPLVFYGPGIIPERKVHDCIGGQIDLFPTLMGILNHPYANNTLGIDLLKERRPYIYFNGDDKYGVIDKEWLLIVREDNSFGLFRYSDKDKADRSAEHPDRVADMKKYAEANLQAFQHVILNGQQHAVLVKE